LSGIYLTPNPSPKRRGAYLPILAARLFLFTGLFNPSPKRRGAYLTLCPSLKRFRGGPPGDRTHIWKSL
jgi:hypothetical protein